MLCWMSRRRNDTVRTSEACCPYGEQTFRGADHESATAPSDVYFYLVDGEPCAGRTGVRNVSELRAPAYLLAANFGKVTCG